MAASSRVAGDRSEAAVIDRLPVLRYVTDDVAEHYDAVAREAVGPVEAGDAIEIKSACVELSSGGPGRFYLREPQHRALLDEDGWYLFVVCAPRDRQVLAYRFLEAADVDADLLPCWWSGGSDRADFRQLYWTALFDGGELDGGG